MPARVLPPCPTLDMLSRQAKELVRAHRSGESTCCATWRQVRRFADSSDSEILAAGVKLTEAQLALARDYGFRSWRGLRDHVTWEHPRRVVALADAHRVCYQCDRISTHLLPRPLLAHSCLTHEELVHNQFENERACLEALDDIAWVPRILDCDPAQLTLLIETIGEPRQSRQPEELPACLARLAELHVLLEERRPRLLPTFPTEVSQAWYFEPPPGRRAELEQTELSEVLDATAQLVCLGEACAVRYAHGDVTAPNITWRDGAPGFIDFETAHRQHQLVDVASLVSAWTDCEGASSLSVWLHAWEEYAARRGAAAESDRREFLYLVIRRAVRRLWKNKAMDAAHRGRATELAVAALRELRIGPGSSSSGSARA